LIELMAFAGIMVLLTMIPVLNRCVSLTGAPRAASLAISAGVIAVAGGAPRLIAAIILRVSGAKTESSSQCE
jgi:hypothetical protein